MFTQIVRTDKGLRLIVTDEMLAALGLSEGDFVDWAVDEDGVLSITPSGLQETVFPNAPAATAPDR